MKPKLWNYKREYYFYPNEREEIEMFYKNGGWILANDHPPYSEPGDNHGLKGYLEFFKPTEFFVGLFRVMMKANDKILGIIDR